MLLSIVTINLNNERGLEKTINSVIGQEFKDYEFIIIDGGSTDRSCDIIKQHPKNISYWVSEKDSGRYNAMNKGLKRVTSEHVLFLNGGDYLLHSSSLTKVFQHKLSADITICDAKRMNQKHQWEDYIQPDLPDAQFFYQYSLCHQSIIYRSDLFKKIGYYNENRQIVSDWEFNLKAVIFNKCSYLHLSIPLVYYDITGESSINRQLMNQERDEVLKTLFSPAERKQFEKRARFNNSLIGRFQRKLKQGIS